MSLSLSLNFCEKACISVPVNTCNFLPLTWTVVGPVLVTVFSSGANAIIKPIYGSVGLTAVTVSDASGTMITITINLTSPFGVSVTTPKYQQVYVSTVVGIAAALQTSATISGNFNSLIVPFQPNICSFCCPQITALALPVFSSLFTPGTNSIIKINGNFLIGSLTFGFGLFKETANINIDPLLPFATQFINPIFITSNASLFTYQYFPSILPICDTTNYLTLIQSNTVGVSVVSCLYESSNSVKFQTNASLTGTEIFSIIVVPKSYYNLASTTLVCSLIANVTVSAAITIVNIPIPSIPIITGVCWFATIGQLSNNGLFVTGVIQLSSTVLTVALSSIQGSYPINLDICCIAYKTQNLISNLLTFP